MPRVRVRIHPTGHLEVQVEGMTDDGCHALVDETAFFVGVVLRRHPLPPAPRGSRRWVSSPPDRRLVDPTRR
jgi:hypothetical protein